MSWVFAVFVGDGIDDAKVEEYGRGDDLPAHPTRDALNVFAALCGASDLQNIVGAPDEHRLGRIEGPRPTLVVCGTLYLNVLARWCDELDGLLGIIREARTA